MKVPYKSKLTKPACSGAELLLSEAKTSLPSSLGRGFVTQDGGKDAEFITFIRGVSWVYMGL